MQKEKITKIFKRSGIPGIFFFILFTFTYWDFIFPDDIVKDKFGALQALFSGLAFAALIIAIFFQYKDLQLTKAEMKNQTYEFEIKRLTDIIYKQLEAMNKKEVYVDSLFYNGNTYKLLVILNIIQDLIKEPRVIIRRDFFDLQILDFNKSKGVNQAFNALLSNGVNFNAIFSKLNSTNTSYNLVQKLLDNKNLKKEDQCNFMDIFNSNQSVEWHSFFLYIQSYLFTLAENEYDTLRKALKTYFNYHDIFSEHHKSEIKIII